MTDLKGDFQAAGKKNFDEKLAKFINELPLIVGEVIDHFQHNQQHTDAQHTEKDLHLDLPAGVDFAALRKMEAYKTLHAVCSGIDAQIVHEEHGSTSRIFVNPLGAYKDSEDAGLINRSTPGKNDSPRTNR
jgi:hypothetical protein